MSSIKVKARQITAPRVATLNSDTAIWTDLTAGTNGAGTNTPILGIGNGSILYDFNINLIDEGYTEYDEVEIGIDAITDKANINAFYSPKAYITEINFDDLTSLTSTTITDLPTLKTITFENTSTTASVIDLYRCDLTGTLDLSSFTNFATSSIRGYDNSNLSNVIFASNTTGNITLLYFYGCDLTGTLDLSMLDKVTTINVSINPNLNNIIFTDSQDVTQLTSIYAHNCNLYPTIDLTGFTAINQLHIYNNKRLESILFANTTVDCRLIYAYQCNLKTLDLSNLINTASFKLYYNTNLTQLTNPVSSTVITDYSVFGTSITSLDLSTLTGLGGNINLNYNSKLKSVDFPISNQVINYITLNYVGIEGEVDLSGLSKLRRLQLEYCPGVTSVLMPTTTENFTEIRIYDTSISTLDVSGITNMTLDFVLQYNQQLETLILPTFSGHTFDEFRLIGNSIKTDVLDLSGITSLTPGGLQIQNEAYIKKIITPSGTVQHIQILYTMGLEEFDALNTTTMTGVIRFYNCIELKTLQLPVSNSGAITDVSILNNYYLQGTVDFSGFTDIKTEFTFQDNPLADVVIPTSGTTLTNNFTYFYIFRTNTKNVNLSGYVGTFTHIELYQNPNLTSIQIPSGTCTGYLWFDQNNLTSLDLSNATALMTTSSNSYFKISDNPMPAIEVQSTLDQLDTKVSSGPTGRRVYMQNMQFTQAEMDTIVASAAVASLISKGYTIYSSVV